MAATASSPTEVLAHLPVDVQRFLLQMAILDRLCAPFFGIVRVDRLTQEGDRVLDVANVISRVDSIGDCGRRPDTLGRQAP